jgi:predicted PurR-regulated permease PerM
MPAPDSASNEQFFSRALETTIRMGLVLLLAAWCFQIVRPFVNPVIWAVIIAIATRASYRWLEAATGGRSNVAAALYAVAGLILIIGPIAALAGTLVDGAAQARQLIEGHDLGVPPPPAWLGDIPLVGETIRRFWSEANQNLESAIEPMLPQLRDAGAWLLSTAAGAGLWVLQFALSILIAAVLQANASGGSRVIDTIARRLMGARGPALADLAEKTVRSVTRGILGVAVIQALAAGFGLVLAGVPFAGLWTLVVLVLAVVQVPTLLLLLPIAIYVSTYAGGFTTVAFLVWSLLVGASDNVLKPLLLGRGAEVPMLVIFLGAIGGFMASGILGLFIGAIVLSLGYTLFVAWLGEEFEESADEPTAAGG